MVTKKASNTGQFQFSLLSTKLLSARRNHLNSYLPYTTNLISLLDTHLFQINLTKNIDRNLFYP